jgi:TPR repeat protein
MDRIFRFDRTIRNAFSVVLIGLCALPAASALANGGARHSALADVSPCSPLLEQILPGDYYFCMGAADMQKGDTTAALRRMQAAAAWGDKTAQKVLGLAYFNGDGVAEDRALGLAWLALSTERKEPENLGLFNSAYAMVTPTQKMQANTLYQHMRVKYADDVAAVRADKLFRRKMRALTSNPVYGSGRCIAGINASQFARANDPESILPCSLASEQTVLSGLQARYDVYFEDWSGRVKTGAVEKIDAAD